MVGQNYLPCLISREGIISGKNLGPSELGN